MRRLDPNRLSRRERQIMDVLYELGSATVAEVQERLPDPPGYSAVRAMLRRLEAKGQVRHKEQGPRYVFSPILRRGKAREKAVQGLVKTFFDGSVAQTVSGILGMSAQELSAEELDQLEQIIDQARQAQSHDE